VPDAGPVIRLTGIAKRYGSRTALAGVDLAVQRGVTGVLGPNGAGKSTLIKLVLGLLRRDAGTGDILGFPIGTSDPALRERIGYVPEEDCIIPLLSGVEAVAFTGELCGLAATESLRRAHEVLDFCGMGDERYRKAEDYSRGMRQKLKLAQALVHDPSLLILDEPTSGLDPEERVLMLRRIRSLAVTPGMSVLFSTHVLPDVQQICDRIVVLAGGAVRLEGDMEQLRRPSRPETVIVTDRDAGPLVERLQDAGVALRLVAPNEIVVDGDATGVSRLLFELARDCDTRVRNLRPGRNSLEELFLHAVAAPDGPGS
jgi:ABC-2 type transport system ATP-binding protein